MLRMLNHHCSNCLRTQRFLDLGTHLVCECCTKRLYHTEEELEGRRRAAADKHKTELQDQRLETA